MTNSSDISKLTIDFFNQFSSIVLWGYKNATHSHRWIHDGYFNFLNSKLSIPVLWLDNKSENNLLIEPNSLVMLPDHHLNIDWDIGVQLKPREDVFFIYHSSLRLSEEWLDDNTITFIKLIEHRNYSLDRLIDPVKIRPFVYISKKSKSVMQPWGSPLEKKDFFKPIFNNNLIINYVGNIWGDLNNISGNKLQFEEFNLACSNTGFKLNLYNNKSEQESVSLVRDSRIAANFGAIGHNQGDYLQCRVFKGISWGVLSLTDISAFKEILLDSYIFRNNWTESLDIVKNIKDNDYRDLVYSQQKSIEQYSYLYHWFNIAVTFAVSYPDKFLHTDVLIDFSK